MRIEILDFYRLVIVRKQNEKIKKEKDEDINTDCPLLIILLVVEINLGHCMKEIICPVKYFKVLVT